MYLVLFIKNSIITVVAIIIHNLLNLVHFVQLFMYFSSMVDGIEQKELQRLHQKYHCSTARIQGI